MWYRACRDCPLFRVVLGVTGSSAQASAQADCPQGTLRRLLRGLTGGSSGDSQEASKAATAARMPATPGGNRCSGPGSALIPDLRPRLTPGGDRGTHPWPRLSPRLDPWPQGPPMALGTQSLRLCLGFRSASLQVSLAWPWVRSHYASVWGLGAPRSRSPSHGFRVRSRDASPRPPPWLHPLGLLGLEVRIGCYGLESLQQRWVRVVVGAIPDTPLLALGPPRLQDVLILPASLAIPPPLPQSAMFSPTSDASHLSRSCGGRHRNARNTRQRQRCQWHSY